MSEINVIQRTQIINVEPVSQSVSVINAGPQGPGGPIGTSTGTIILPGTTPPLPSDGAVGNYWIDQTADILYGPKKTVAPVWPIAMYGAQTPPALLGENRRTTNPVFSTTLLPVNIDLPVVTRLKVYLHINFGVPSGTEWAFDCRIDSIVVGRFAFPIDPGGAFVGGSVIVPGVAAGPHTVSLYLMRTVGTSGVIGFNITPNYPAYLAVYKDRA